MQENEEAPNPFMSARESYRQSNRRILVVGPPGTGKTTFSVSASKFAGDVINGEVHECTDVAIFQGDAEGVMGAEDSGYRGVRVMPLDRCETWPEYGKKLQQGIDYLAPLVAKGEVGVVIIDLAHPQRLIERFVKPNTPEGWGLVKVQGMHLFGMFSALQGVTIIGNAQIKSNQVYAKPAKIAEMTEKVAASATGGELSAFGADLTKGIGAPWKEHCSFIFVREAKRAKASDDDHAGEKKIYYTHTQSSRKFEAKSRAASRLPARMPGDWTLRNVMKRVYSANGGSKQ